MVTEFIPAFTSNEAKQRGLKYYFTGEPCKHGHLSVRDTTHYNRCLECIRQANRKANSKYAKTAAGKVSVHRNNAKYRERNLELCRLKDHVKYYQKRLDKSLDDLSKFTNN